MGISLPHLAAMKDSDIRQIILSDLDRKYKNDLNTMIIEELGLCQGEARVDIAVVNGSIHGFEIKSDQDTLNRLAGQAAIYSRVLDSITLVVGSKHLNEALKVIPKWWGVVVAKEKSGQVCLKKRRNGQLNPRLDPFALAQLLWRDEAFEALKKLDLHKGLANKPRTILWNKLTEHLATDELLALVRNFLRSRENWRSGYQQA
jgi:hypothetical protein